MAKPLEFNPAPAVTEPDARAELDDLVGALHAHGVLRLATAVVKSNAQWMRIVAAGFDGEGPRNALRNLATLLMALARIDPDRFRNLVEALGAGADELVDRSVSGDARAPGVRGAWRMLHDDELWRALAPLFDAVKVAGKELSGDSPASRAPPLRTRGRDR